MKIESMHVGMRVKHPQYGHGTAKAITEHTAEIRFDEGIKTIDPLTSETQPAEPQAAVTGLETPLETFIEDVARAVVKEMGLEDPDAVVEELGARWHRGKAVLHPADPTLQTKEVPLEVFFHKVVMIRNNLRVLEQKINAHDGLTDGDKVEMQQYITRCYGSLTTFNVLFKSKEGQFGGRP
jgi:hypothetical protein